MGLFRNNFSQMINWTALGHIGNSKIARLTILMPVIGYLILFNSTLQEFFEVKLPLLDNENANFGFWRALYDQNLYFLYFGLLTFGSGVAVYSITAPQQIKRHGSAEDYILAMEEVRTNNLVVGSFDKVMNEFLTNLKGDERLQGSDYQCAAFPSEVSNDVHRLIEEMFLEVSLDDSGQFYTGSGYLITSKVIEAMYAGIRAARAVKDLMDVQVMQRPKDVFYMHYRVLDYERPGWRRFVFCFYALGLLLTFIPSVTTSVIILCRWLS